MKDFMKVYAAAKPYLRDYVETITERSKSGLYCCPLPDCMSGHGPNGSGAFSIEPDGTRWHCFSCSRGGDIFDLVKLMENLQNDKDAASFLADHFPGIEAGEPPKNKPEPEKLRPIPKNRPGLYTRFIEDCKANNAEALAYFAGRGLAPDTVARFRLGYCLNYPGLGPAVIMPYNRENSYYMARSVNGKAFRKPGSQEAGAEPVFNVEALANPYKPCFICEAPIDAMSLEQAGAAAVALGGTAHGNIISALKAHRPVLPLVLALDNDGPGIENANKLAGELTALNIPYIQAVFSLDKYPGEAKKDANDLLRADPEQLRADVLEIMKAASAIRSGAFTAEPVAGDQIPAADPSGEAAALPVSDPTPEAVTDPERLAVLDKVYRVADYIITSEYDIDIAYFARYKDRKTGFANIDRYITLYPGLCALGGAASLGKTSFAVNLAENLVRAGETVLYFALEQEPVELITKIIARNLYRKDPASALDNISIKNGATNEVINEIRAELVDSMSRFFVLNEDFLTTVETVKDTVKSFIAATGVKPVVIIDYLQLLSPSPFDPGHDPRSNTDYNLKALKRLQRENELFILLISNFNRSSYGDPVSYEAFKESGMIEYTCDYVLGLQLAVLENPDYWRRTGARGGEKPTTEKQKNDMVTHAMQERPKIVELVGLKNRNGRQSFKCFFRYYVNFDAFEVEENYIFDYAAKPKPGTAAAVFGSVAYAGEAAALPTGTPELAMDPETASALDAIKAEKKKAKGTKKA